MLAAIAKLGERRYGRRPLMIPNGLASRQPNSETFAIMAGLRPLDANREEIVWRRQDPFLPGRLGGSDHATETNGSCGPRGDS